MKVNSVSFQSNRKSGNSTKSTGAVAALAVGLTVASGYTKNIKFKKWHKWLAPISLVAIVAHIISLGRNRS